MGSKVEGLTTNAIEALKEHPFYGNVRELENILERAVIFSDGPLLDIQDLDLRQSVARLDEIEEFETKPQMSDDFGTKSLKEIEIEAIIRSLHRWEGNRTRAAEELGISRRTLINKIAEYKLEL